MSTYIEGYIEYKETNEKSWKLATIGNNSGYACIDSNLRYEIENIDTYGKLSIESIANRINKSEVSQGFLKIFKSLDDSDNIRAIDIDFLIQELRKIEDKFINDAKSLYIALGCNFINDIYEDSSDDDEKYDDDGNIRASWNPMTFNVNKKLLEIHNNNYLAYSSAISLLSKLKGIKNMIVGDNYDFDAPKFEFRLILITT